MQEFLFTIALVIDAFQEPHLFVPLLVLGAALALCRSRTDALVFIAAALLAWFLSNGLKYLFAVPRPPEQLIENLGYRFPSTHALVGSAMLTSLLITGIRCTQKYSILLYLAILSLFTILLIAWSRVYINVHEVIDVAAGVALGSALAALLHYFFSRFRRSIQ